MQHSRSWRDVDICAASCFHHGLHHTTSRSEDQPVSPNYLLTSSPIWCMIASMSKLDYDGQRLIYLGEHGVARGAGFRKRGDYTYIAPPVPELAWQLAHVDDPGCEVSERCQVWLEEAYHFFEGLQVSGDVHLKGDTPTRWPDLYSYQRTAAHFAAESPHGALLALDPGLGKTVVALMVAELMEAEKIVVVTQLSLVHFWLVEIDKWIGGIVEAGYVEIAHKRVPDFRARWSITTYETVVRHIRASQKDKPYECDLLIIDESVLIANRRTKRFQALRRIATNAKKVVLLSGRPTRKFADQLWTQFHIIDPEAFRSYWRFAERWCHLRTTPWVRGLVIGDRDPDALRRMAARMMLVVRVKDALPQLPNEIIRTIPVELGKEQRRVYDELENDLVTTLESGREVKVMHHIALITRALQAVSNLRCFDPDTGDVSAKADALEELAPSLPLPHIVWDIFLPSLRAAHDRLAKDFRVAYLTGDVHPDDRQPTIDAFQAGEIDFLFAHPGVGKYGHTLTAAKGAVYMTRNFEGETWVQSLFRVKRIGTTEPPLITVLQARKTIDQLVEANLSGKIKSYDRLTAKQFVRLLQQAKEGLL